jgi:hypothetical protein
MKLKILSDKVGKVGAYFEPTPGINVQALIDGGFIAYESESTETPKKSSTIKKTTKE